jgi:hypothetical protein
MPTLSSDRCRFILVLLVAVTVQAQDLNIKKSISVGGNLVSSTETSIKGARERKISQTPTGNVVTIRQCDLKQTITLNEQAQTYLVTKDAQEGATLNAAAKASGPANSGGYITESAVITDLGERKAMNGYPARHLKIKVTTESSKDACSQVNQSYEVDGWYSDIGAGMPAACQQFLPPVRQQEGCNDRIVRKRSGSGKPGYPLAEVITIHGGDGSSTQMSIQTSEITKPNLENSLFDVPAGFREVKTYAELKGPATQVAQQQPAMAPGTSQVGDNQQGMGPAAGPKQVGKIRIGVAPPDAQVGQGSHTTQDYSTPFRNAEITLMSGSAVDVVPLDAHIPVQLQAEAQQKQCDYLMLSSVILKHSQGAFGKFTKYGTLAASATPVGAMVHGVAGVAATQAVNVVVSQMAQQQATRQIAAFNGQVKSKDDVTVQYQLLPAGQNTATLEGTLQGKAKFDGEDVVTPMLTQTATAVLAQVSLIAPNSQAK